MVSIEQIHAWINDLAPFRYAEHWDNCGLQIGDAEAQTGGILVALDPLQTVVEEARRLRCGCVVTHHPLIFKPLHSLRAEHFPDDIIIEFIRGKLNLIVAHTNLDSARGGTNDQLAHLLDIHGIEPLATELAWRDEPSYGGMGRIGVLQKECSLAELTARVRSALGGSVVKASGDPHKMIKRVALCSGSGGTFLDAVIARECDVFITGDVKYHDAQKAEASGVGLIDAGHFASEKLVVEPLAGRLREFAAKAGAEVQVYASETEKDPFWDIT